MIPRPTKMFYHPYKTHKVEPSKGNPKHFSISHLSLSGKNTVKDLHLIYSGLKICNLTHLSLSLSKDQTLELSHLYKILKAAHHLTNLSLYLQLEHPESFLKILFDKCPLKKLKKIRIIFDGAT